MDGRDGRMDGRDAAGGSGVVVDDVDGGLLGTGAGAVDARVGSPQLGVVEVVVLVEFDTRVPGGECTKCVADLGGVGVSPRIEHLMMNVDSQPRAVFKL